MESHDITGFTTICRKFICSPNEHDPGLDEGPITDRLIYMMIGITGRLHASNERLNEPFILEYLFFKGFREKGYYVSVAKNIG